MEKKHILIVDDEQDICDILRYNLEASGFTTETASSAEEALRLPLENYALLLLDVMMPGMSGYELAHQLKSDEHTRQLPIIFLTAKDSVDDTVLGLNLGADDYITKPFAVREVTARVRAVLRRREGEEQLIVNHGLVLDKERKAVSIDGTDTGCTRTEFELLCMLMEQAGHVLTRQQLMEQVWPGVVVSDRTIDVHIARLRKKLGPYAATIVSRTGFGYSYESSRL